ncbi:hypothetical protein [Aquincola sp. J276]|uniref:hypothetical protein n=1 Tax=Aquincola sp. J276 TaxID=2898432 RepID=UPI002151D2F5|nr:hypothetical protein [Aquincola sp. J276]MCR5868846.1 hypothetical protein [Aquincola sp. J276]
MQSPPTPFPDATGARRRRLLAAGLALPALPWLAAPALSQVLPQPPAAAGAAGAITAPERALFVRPHLAGMKPGQTLQYGFRHAGTLEAGFDDSVTIHLGPAAEGGCCSARGEFLSGPRSMVLPDLPSATSNPVILYFLERDVREMQRLTRGQQNHFRKRIRLALAERGQMREVTLRWRGQPVAGSEITVSPYLDDPNRMRFERFAGKHYSFVLSEAVPGGVVALRSTVAGEGGAAEPLIEDILTLDGAEPPPPART